MRSRCLNHKSRKDSEATICPVCRRHIRGWDLKEEEN